MKLLHDNTCSQTQFERFQSNDSYEVFHAKILCIVLVLHKFRIESGKTWRSFVSYMQEVNVKNHRKFPSLKIADKSSALQLQFQVKKFLEPIKNL